MKRKLALSAALAAAVACSHNDANNTPVPPPPADCTLPAPVASSLDGGQVLELGTHQTGDSITFTVPAGTASVSILQQAVGNVPLQVVFGGSTVQIVDNSVVPRFVFFPDGGTAYDDHNPPGAGADKTIDPSSFYVEYSQDTPVASAFTFPNTANSLGAGVTPGAWRMVVGDFAHECATEFQCLDGGTDQDKYDIKVVLKPQSATAFLDVNFFIIGSANTRAGVPFTAAIGNAGTDASVQRMISTFKALYGNAGITVRNVTFFDVSAADRALYSSIVVDGTTSGEGPCDQLDQMFLLSAGSPGPAMNIFLVNALTDISASGSNSLVGIDGTIPGPATLAGTVHSGAAVAMADLFATSAGSCAAGAIPNVEGCGADVVAYIVAHETGHFLGLFHTTESGGDLIDPLSDTGKCACTACGNTGQKTVCGKTDSSAPMLTADQCVGGTSVSGCAGGDNLLFW
ncbi:MAG TPA: hypothetical protein VH083_18600, partial [Myxococcales bacterium]|nr:hypothetical protein [Myxococcales bacterium]